MLFLTANDGTLQFDWQGRNQTSRYNNITEKLQTIFPDELFDLSTKHRPLARNKNKRKAGLPLLDFQVVALDTIKTYPINPAAHGYNRYLTLLLVHAGIPESQCLNFKSVLQAEFGPHYAVGLVQLINDSCNEVMSVPDDYVEFIKINTSLWFSPTAAFNEIPQQAIKIIARDFKRKIFVLMPFIFLLNKRYFNDIEQAASNLHQQIIDNCLAPLSACYSDTPSPISLLIDLLTLINQENLIWHPGNFIMKKVGSSELLLPLNEINKREINFKINWLKDKLQEIFITKPDFFALQRLKIPQNEPFKLYDLLSFKKFDSYHSKTIKAIETIEQMIECIIRLNDSLDSPHLRDYQNQLKTNLAIFKKNLEQINHCRPIQLQGCDHAINPDEYDLYNVISDFPICLFFILKDNEIYPLMRKCDDDIEHSHTLLNKAKFKIEDYSKKQSKQFKIHSTQIKSSLQFQPSPISFLDGALTVKSGNLIKINNTNSFYCWIPEETEHSRLLASKIKNSNQIVGSKNQHGWKLLSNPTGSTAQIICNFTNQLPRQLPLFWEFKSEGKERWLAAALPADKKNRSCLLIPLVYLKQGLHTSRDKTNYKKMRFEMSIKLPSTDINSSPSLI